MKKSTKGLLGFVAGAIAGVAAYKIIKDKKANQEEVIVDCDDFEECQCDCECDCTCECSAEEAVEDVAEETTVAE